MHSGNLSLTAPLKKKKKKTKPNLKMLSKHLPEESVLGCKERAYVCWQRY